MNKMKYRLLKLILITAAIIFIGIVIMSILGAKDLSYHLISLETGWAGRLYDAMWLAFTSLVFFILGTLASDTIREYEGEPNNNTVFRLPLFIIVFTKRYRPAIDTTATTTIIPMR